MYRQSKCVGNLENVGWCLDGHECLYNVFMMEELHSIFAAGAGAVTKLMRYRLPSEGGSVIERIFMPKYPYEYLRDAERMRLGDHKVGIPSRREKVLEFFNR